MTDDLSAVLAEIRELIEARDALVRRMQTAVVGTAEFNAAQDRLAARVPYLLAAVDAPLRFHQRTPLYGNAATDDEPDACPHPPDSDLHFEADDGSGEWLCGGRPEGAVCSSCLEDGLPVAWPCPEYAAILAALTGEDDGG